MPMRPDSCRYTLAREIPKNLPSAFCVIPSSVLIARSSAARFSLSVSMIYLCGLSPWSSAFGLGDGGALFGIISPRLAVRGGTTVVVAFGVRTTAILAPNGAG